MNLDRPDTEVNLKGKMMVDYGGLGGIWNGREVNDEDKFETSVDRAFGQLMRNEDEACVEVWSALANLGWVHKDGDTAAYSFRAAGDLVAAIKGSGMYMDWYCSGPEGVVSQRFAEAMKGEGWAPDQSYYD